MSNIWAPPSFQRGEASLSWVGGPGQPLNLQPGGRYLNPWSFQENQEVQTAWEAGN